ncbi:MAG: hypothetical protein ACJ764_08705 [Solirubrobacteraceae bacterium]
MRRPAAWAATAALLLSGGLSAVCLWPDRAAAAGPSGVYARVLHVYQTHGSIPPCQFTSQQLAAALNGVDTYGQQYYADFIAAINAALAARASGACSSSHVQSGALPSAPGPAGEPLPRSLTAPTSAGVPAPIVLLAVVGLLAALAAALLAFARGGGGGAGRGGGGGGAQSRAGRGRRSANWRHGVAEASYRAGESWEAILDRLRR